MLHFSYYGLLALSLNAFAAHSGPDFTFRTAKKYAAQIHANGKSLYCNCKVNKTGDKLSFRTCGYRPKTPSSRAKQLEWEHVVPAHKLGSTFKAWDAGHPKCKTVKGETFKGRKCLHKVSPTYRKMEADLYNLYPAVAEINAIRQNLPMGFVRGEKREFGKCDVEISEDTIEPAASRRGEIARVYLYMASVYDTRIKLTKTEEELYEFWDESDPANPKECGRYLEIQSFQKGVNPILEERCEGQVHF